MNPKIRIKLQAYDHQLIDRSSERIVKAAEPTGAMIKGPTPLPTKNEVFTVLRSPHVNKKSREKFVQKIHSRLIDIFPTSPRTIEALMKLELPPGVDVSIKA
ncbi:MAG: 30S ribosomal protein S10 [Bacteroidota bacterium]